MLIRRRGMEIVVNHVTRMRGGHVCVAGLDREGRHVRPVLEVGRIRRSSTTENGGPFGLGAVVELGRPRPRPAPPEVEDCVFDLRSTRAKGMTDPTDFWRLLDELSSTSLPAIFGGMLTRDGRTASMPVGTGTASLGVYRPPSSIRIDRSFGKLRVLVSDSRAGNVVASPDGPQAVRARGRRCRRSTAGALGGPPAKNTGHSLGRGQPALGARGR